MAHEPRESADDEAWVLVPDEVAAALDALADHCHAVVVAWFQIARGLAARPPESSPEATDADQFRRAKPRAPANVEHGPGQQAGLYIDVIGQHLLAVEALLRARRIAVALWPLVRAELEVAGRVAWLLDPGIEERPGEVRVARLFLEAISSLQRERYTTGKYDKTKAKQAKALRDQKIADARALFDHVDLDLSSLDTIETWNVGGESLAGVGTAVSLFVDRNFHRRTKALYDVLSDYSHPSLLAIARQTAASARDGVASRPWTVEFRTIEDQVRLACVILYKGAHLVAAYYELDASALEQWADSVPSGWFSPSTGEGTQP